MIRFFFRFLSILALAVAVIMAVIDATRSIASDELVLTPLISSWEAVSPESLASFRAGVQKALLPELWDPAIVSVLTLPGFGIFLGVSLLFYLIGRRPERRLGRLRHVSG